MENPGKQLRFGYVIKVHRIYCVYAYMYKCIYIILFYMYIYKCMHANICIYIYGHPSKTVFQRSTIPSSAGFCPSSVCGRTS